MTSLALMPHSFGHTFGSGQNLIPGGHMHPVGQGLQVDRANCPQYFWQVVGLAQIFPSTHIQPYGQGFVGFSHFTEESSGLTASD